MTTIPSFDDYIDRLRQAGAPVIQRLQAGASRSDIERLNNLSDTSLPPEAFDYWSRVNGVEEVEPWDHSILFPLIFVPRSIDNSIEMDRVHAQLRSEVVISPEEDAKFWPPGMVGIAGEDGNGLFLNCRSGSPTYGAIYDRGVAEVPLVRFSNSMEDYFRTLVAAFDNGIIRVLRTNEQSWNAGALWTDVEGLYDLGYLLNPDCPGFDRGFDSHNAEPDWI